MEVGKIELTRIPMVIPEGKARKGGVNNPPTSPRPAPPAGQGRKCVEEPRKYTIPEIRKYLDGCRLVDCSGVEAEDQNGALDLAIKIIEFPDCGIEAVTRGE